jgi:hypothetical protein
MGKQGSKKKLQELQGLSGSRGEKSRSIFLLRTSAPGAPLHRNLLT